MRRRASARDALAAIALFAALACPGQALARSEVDVAYGPHPRQRYDIHLPARVDRSTPTIVHVHGGAWAFGDKAHAAVTAKRDRWVAAGAIVVSTNYRLLPDADPLRQADDVARALASVQRRVAALGADPSRLALMGHSAGAHLAALVTASPTLRRDAGVGPWAATVLLDSAAVDLPAVMTDDPPGLYVRAFGEDPAYWRSASPLHRLQGPTPPVLAVCASRRPDACPANTRFVDALNAAGGKARVLPVSLSHRQINRALGLDEAYTRDIERFLRDAGLAL